MVLSRHYIDRFGQILHHNVDKALLSAGRSDPSFGGGKVIEPIDIYLSGRATMAVNGEKSPRCRLGKRMRSRMGSARISMRLIRTSMFACTALFGRDRTNLSMSSSASGQAAWSSPMTPPAGQVLPRSRPSKKLSSTLRPTSIRKASKISSQHRVKTSRSWEVREDDAVSANNLLRFHLPLSGWSPRLRRGESALGDACP